MVGVALLVVTMPILPITSLGLIPVATNAVLLPLVAIKLLPAVKELAPVPPLLIGKIPTTELLLLSGNAPYHAT